MCDHCDTPFFALVDRDAFDSTSLSSSSVSLQFGNLLNKIQRSMSAIRGDTSSTLFEHAMPRRKLQKRSVVGGEYNGQPWTIWSTGFLGHQNVSITHTA
jgi:hypothetical protein